jgi:anti-sigma B factor antagonist
VQPDPIPPPAQLSVTMQLDQDHAYVVAAGEIDSASAAAFHEACQMAIDQHPASGVAVDLAGVTFIDSTGLSALIAAYNAATRTGIALTVAKYSPIAGRKLELAGLLGMLTRNTRASPDKNPADGPRSGQ